MCDIVTSRTALLDLFRDSDRAPQASREYLPTPTRPVQAVEIGKIDGVPVFAYGVCMEFLAASGPMMATYIAYRWHWYSDQEEAREHANFLIYEESEEAREWTAVPILNENAAQVEARTVTPLIGRPFQVYRYLGVGGFTFVWRLGRQADVCKQLHQSLHELYPAAKIDVPSHTSSNASIAAIEVPSVAEELYATCPHCGMELRRWGTLVLGQRLHSYWFLKRDEAEARHAAVVEWVEVFRRSEDQRTLGQLTAGIWCAADALRGSLRFRCFFGTIPDALLSDFTAQYDADPSSRQLNDYEELERLTKEVQKALDDEELRRLEEIEAHGLVQRLEQILVRHFPICPFCAKAYERSGEWLTEALLFGEMVLKCQCPERGWATFLDDLGSTPNLVQEIKKSEQYDNQAPRRQMAMDKQCGAIELATVSLRPGEIVVQLVAIDRVTSLQPGILVNRERLMSHPELTGWRREVWPRTKADLARRQAEHLETKLVEPGSEVVPGTVVKLPLEWNPDQGNWSRSWRDDNGTVIYAVHRERVPAEMVAGWWYCHQLTDVDRARKPGFRLVIVVPIIPVPVEPRPVPQLRHGAPRR